MEIKIIKEDLPEDYVKAVVFLDGKEHTFASIGDASTNEGAYNSFVSLVAHTVAGFLQFARPKAVEQSVQPTPESGRDLPAESSESKGSAPAKSG